MVLAPESELVAQLTTAEQKAEVQAYLDATKKRTERERIADRRVTGVFSGSYAINPLTREAIPVWISDYVLAGYGTGAIMSQDKTLNSINIVGDYAYFSTNFGILILNLKKKEISNTYVLNKKVYSSVVKDNVIYAATADGLYSGKLSDNLLDANNWVLSNAIAFNQLAIFENKIIGNQPNNGIYSFDNNSQELTNIISGNFLFMEVFDNKLIAGNGNSIAIFDHYNSVKYMVFFLPVHYP